MKNRRIDHWLDIAEYISLAGVGAGSVASALAQQFLYATTPLSLAVIVGISNRRRLQAQQQQVQQRVGDMDMLRQDTLQLKLHLQSMPQPETIAALERSQHQHQQAIEEMAGHAKSAYAMMGERLVTLERHDYDSIRQDIHRLRATHGSIHTLLDNMQAGLKEMTTREQIETAERAIAQLQQRVQHVNRQLQELGDSTRPALAQLKTQLETQLEMAQLPASVGKSIDFGEARLDEIVNLIADLVPRRDWNTIKAQVQALQHQCQAQAERDQQLAQEIDAIQQQLPESGEEALAALQRRWQAILDIVQDKIQVLPSATDLEAVLQEMLHRRLQAFPDQASPHQLLIDLPSEATESKSPLPKSPSATSSQLALTDGLRQAERQVILVWPWLSSYRLDPALAEQFEQFLASGKSLSVGWCSQRHRSGAHFLTEIGQTWDLDGGGPAVRQRTLQHFLQLKRHYPQLLRVKLLDAGENFLVLDRDQAVVGVEHNLVLSTQGRPLGLKVRTTSDTVINSLLDRYTRVEQDSGKADTHWRQAMAQYDLGEYAAAIAEMDRLLAAVPEDAVLHNMRGILHCAQRDFDAALSDFSLSIRLGSTAGSAYCNRGFLRHERGDIQGAIADFDQAVRLMPNSAIPLFYRGRAWEALKCYDRALSHYNAACELAPDVAVLIYRRAIVHRYLQQMPQAEADLNTAAWHFIRQNNPGAARRCLQTLKRWQQSPAAAERSGTLLQKVAERSLYPVNSQVVRS
ncbi:MAG: tetratricopeptide repeat protein [Elainellaceae cyanobacterium]